MKFLASLLFCLFAVFAAASACVYDSECGATGRCVNSLCLQVAECTRHLDCIGRGLYYECTNQHCVTSSHKICRSNDDCKKNVLHKKCVSDRCT